MRVGAKLLIGAVRTAAMLLDASEREAVLGDLQEEGATAWEHWKAVSGLAARRAAVRLCKGEALLPVAVSGGGEHPAEQGSWPEWVLPLAAGLVLATAVTAVLVPKRNTALTWSGVFSHSALLLSLAATAAIGGALLIYRFYREYFRRPGSALLLCAWSSAIWIPLVLLVWSQRAVAAVLAPIPIAVLVASFAKRRQAKAVEVPNGPPPMPSEPAALREAAVFQAVELTGGPPVRTAVLCACLLEACAASAAAGELPLTCSLAVLAAACLAWAFTPTEREVRTSTVPGRARMTVLPCFLLTCLALAPFVRYGWRMSRLAGLVLAAGMPSAPHVKTAAVRSYAEVILMAPELPKKAVIPDPPKSMLGGAMRISKPTVIPFDGAYWYFQAPALQPHPELKVERGDPTKAHIHSSDFYPLEMEAHQGMGRHLQASCCSAIAVKLLNADIRRGRIDVEARLRDVSTHATRTVSLGTVPVRSSLAERISTMRPDVEETLHYSLRGKAEGFAFNEITLVFKLASERELAGAQVKVLSFTLEP